MNTVAIRLPARLIRLSGPVSATMGEFALNGPTCDSLDVLPGTFTLPVDVREGDWIEIDQVGAYSNALATRFNGFHPETFVQVFEAPPALAAARRSEERRVGKEGVRTCRSRWWQCP